MATNTLGRPLNGRTLVERRRELRLSQGALARAVGISQSLMSYIESGDRNASPDVCAALAEKLQVDERSLYAEPEAA